MSKSITIEQLLPLLKKGWVAMDKNGRWVFYTAKPRLAEDYFMWVRAKDSCGLYPLPKWVFNIAPFDGDWKQSLRRVVNSQKDTKNVVNSKTKKRVHKLDNNKIQAKQLDNNELQAKYEEAYRFAPKCFGFLTPEQIKEDFERWKRREGHK